MMVKVVNQMFLVKISARRNLNDDVIAQQLCSWIHLPRFRQYLRILYDSLVLQRISISR